MLSLKSLISEENMLAYIRKSVIILFFCLTTFQVNGQIIETMNMYELYPFLKPNMLIVFDIDNTLIEPVQTLGSDQWFHFRLDQYISFGYKYEDALEFSLKEWMAVQNLTKVKLVEAGTDQIIADLQSKGYPIIGLTTRGLGMSMRTLHQLQSVGIDLEATAPSKAEFHYMNGRGVLYRDGILFTANTHKGEALRKYLEIVGFTPTSIMFINDKYSHIVPVAEYCEGISMPFVGLRYGYVDQKVNNFPKDIAMVQYYNFGHIMSDEAADRVLHEHLK